MIHKYLVLACLAPAAATAPGCVCVEAPQFHPPACPTAMSPCAGLPQGSVPAPVQAPAPLRPTVSVEPPVVLEALPVPGDPPPPAKPAPEAGVGPTRRSSWKPVRPVRST